MEDTTDSIRALAPKWSLAGDEKLLNLLQNTHQKIVTKCREVNTKLNEMASTLNDASINLQNVNNKFMALSNSQFIESRVFDDDADITTDAIPVEEPQPPALVDDITMLKRSLAILDNAHETAEILDDSDTDDSDAEISVVLKPKDAYAHRPLPYIIGSQAWKTKWHAGLVIEDSDSDSSTSKHDVRELEQYSESEDDVQTDKHIPDNTISESSSSFHSERDKDLSSISEKKQTPADIAAELAARLGQAPPRVLEKPEETLPQPTTKTVYRPHKPVSSTIFSDEPPPLDPTYEHSSESQDEDDIFAEINKKQPYNKTNTAQNRLTDDLFGISNDFTDFSKEPKSAKPKSTLFDDELEPELFVEKSTKAIAKESISNRNVHYEDNNTKKPIGGISLFGSNKGTENIGAAILNRNRRKSTSTDSESDRIKNTIKNDTVAYDNEEDNSNNANYIFDNLFAKAKEAEQKMRKPAKIDKPVKQEKAKSKEKDLFSDNIFDDIDDIFTSNIKIPTKEATNNAKSIFDDDDDDLFSEIAKKPQEIAKAKVTKATSSSIKKSIFDSDDDLFSDVKVTKEASSKSDKVKPNNEAGTESQVNNPSSSSKISKENNNNDTTTSKQPITSDLTQNIHVKDLKEAQKTISKSIFDSDSDDELFSDKVKPEIEKRQENTKNIKNTETEAEVSQKRKEAITVDTLKSENAKEFRSPSLFEEDEIDDLFINANKVKVANVTPENTYIEHVIPEDIPDFKDKVEVTEEIPVKVKTSNTFVENRPKDIVNKNPVVLDTKPYVFSEIDKQETNPSKIYDELEDNLLTRHVENKYVNTQENVIKDDFIETSQEPTKVQNKNSSTGVPIESKLQETVSAVITSDNIEEENIATKNETLIPETQEPNFAAINKISQPQELNKPIFDAAAVKEKQVLLPKQKIPIPIAASFDDIFSEPPAFEKTKETKKATNVNALFEDDSDDEALFFKKNDVISDEKPDVFLSSANFGLFNDEPPALVEVDITSKNSKNYNLNDDDDLFSSIPSKEVKTSNITGSDLPKIDKRDTNPEHDQPIPQSENPTQKLLSDVLKSNLFSSPETPKSEAYTVKQITKGQSKVIPDSDEELFNNMPVPDTSQIENTLKTELDIKYKEISTDQLDELSSNKNEKDKKIGKLKTKNLNINVQALVPGASPKKIPKNLSDDAMNTCKDDTNFTNKQTEETKEDELSITEVDNAQPKEVKSISFESKTESEVLDNKLSKQRARIQVKRRPSSRRARHEAVRKSVIDTDDDTDNSSSFDEPVPKYLNQKRPQRESNEVKNPDEITKTSADRNLTDTSNKQSYQDEAQIEHLSEHKINTDKGEYDGTDGDSIKKSIFKIHDEITKDDIKNNKNIDEIDSKNPSNVEKCELSKEITQNVPVKDEQNEEIRSPQSTTKVVYVLNDEDIFSNKTEKHKVEVDVKGTTEYEDNEDLFKNKDIKTIGNTYKEVNNPNIETTTSKRDTDIDTKSTKSHARDVETIKRDKESSKAVQPARKEVKSLFDLSDDDEDLFGKSTKSKKVEVKSKLFESDSEDDLFSGKKKDIKVKNKEDIKVKEVNTKKSLFGDEEDDDLFGVKTKTDLGDQHFPVQSQNPESSKRSSTSSKSTSTKDAAKPTEIVFDDPLSMLEDD